MFLKSKDEIVEHVQQYVTVEGSKNYVDWHSTDCTGTTSYMILILNISCYVHVVLM